MQNICWVKEIFLAVVDELVTHFQAAYVGEYDLHLLLDTLHRSRPRPLLAQPISTRPVLHSDEMENEEEAAYRWEDAEAESDGE
jgi:hypothetical protein